jgi:hypothetical protein
MVTRLPVPTVQPYPDIVPANTAVKFGAVSNMLTKGVTRFKVIASNPLALIERSPESDPTKVRWALDSEEVLAIFERSSLEMVPLWRLYATTGMRKMEVVTLRWSDIDCDGKAIVIKASVAKGKRAQRILLDDAMLAMLGGRRESESGAGHPGHATLEMTMRVYAQATDRSMSDAINALPFAKATAPAHVLNVVNTPVSSWAAHSCAASDAAKAG